MTLQPPTRLQHPLPPGSIAALVRDVLSTQLVRLQRCEAGARLEDHDEALHDMRVAARRLRTALRLFAGVLPRQGGTDPDPVTDPQVIDPQVTDPQVTDPQVIDPQVIDRSLRWLTTELGVVRDLDVQLERIREQRAVAGGMMADALAPLVRLLLARREEAHSVMVNGLDTPRLGQLYHSLEGLIAIGPERLPQRALEPATDLVPEMLQTQYRAFRRRARQLERGEAADAATLHATRKRVKRLRYAAQFANGLDRERTTVLASALELAQDLLGLHQDAEIAIAQLRKIVRDDGDDLPGSTLFAMGELAQRYRDDQRAHRFAAAEATVAVRPCWRRLCIALGLATGGASSLEGAPR